ncbi:MAG: fibronectin type III domain-containing protein [Lewinellaceae bacterium]|nr:fibronectin type III domain-containing protein [Saprospiraceae bacterium]MCB9354941.1 fibronectin type III domain-containing protein [Lewinellaceae bacterium]
MTRFSLIIIRSFGIASVLFFLLPAVPQAQQAGYVEKWLESYRQSGSFQQITAFTVDHERNAPPSAVDRATLMEPDQNAMYQLLQSSPSTITFIIPNAYGSDLELELVKTDILAPGFSVGELGDQAEDNVSYQPGLHYRGIVRGKPGSLAALSVFDGDLMAMAVDGEDVYQLGKMEDGSEQYILYRTRDLKAASPFQCLAEEEAVVPDDENAAGDRNADCKTVQVYFECDYKMYLDKGASTNNVTNYVTGLFNQVATLYANENVSIAISQIYVWTSSDPYASYGSTSSVLNAFRTTRGTNFNGNLAHFLSTRNLGGGIAYLDVICFKNYAFGVSAINNSYQNIPTFSWTVEVVTHELGHNLGSWHTHSCNWPGGALDNCYTPEGNCSPGPAPGNGGTIMSYCHLTSYGINFNNGFGQVPGDRIRTKVQSASCLASSGSTPTGLTTSGITSGSATLSWGAVAGTSTYTVQFKTSANSSWTIAGTTNTTSFTLSNLAANTTYNWQVKADCSDYSSPATFTTGSSGGGGGSSTCNAPTGLTNTNITSSSAVFFWGAVSSASSYTVQYKKSNVSSWTTAGNTSSTAYSIAGLSASTTYNWRVKANCSTSYSGVATFTTLSNGSGAGCNPPVNLTNVSVTAKTAVLSWSPVSGASSYTLQIRYASSNKYYTLGTVPVTQVGLSGLQPNTSYYWRVKANCSAYSSPKLLTTPASLQDPGAESLVQPTLYYAQIYPNPAAEYLNLNYTGDILAGAEILITDIAGRLALRRNLTQQEEIIDVSTLQPGVFLLTIVQEGKKGETLRFVKM